jgi:hypothetical protein
MYYAFFETGNEVFFTKLIETFCSTYIRYTVDIYESVKQECGKLNWEEMAQFIEKNGRDLDIFNCAQHLLRTYCLNNACEAGHTTVLTQDQEAKFEEIMKNGKNQYCRSHYPGNKKSTWREIQGIFQNHKIFGFFTLEVLRFKRNGDPDKCWAIYIEKVNKKTPATGYAYVRAQTGSDYDKFKASTTLNNVVPCDEFQSIG